MATQPGNPEGTPVTPVTTPETPATPLTEQKNQVTQASQGLAQGLGGGTEASFHKDMNAIQKLMDQLNPFKKKPTP